MISLLCEGHSLLIGVPGLAKTLMVNTLAQVLGLRFNRIQFTPDLMPADITGTEILEEDKRTGKRTMKFLQGPVFANIILADEINRTPPKTQAALLQAMQERQVTVGGITYTLDLPFTVLATQNPIEQEGTYPLPEAQLDRFMFSIPVDYPSSDEEEEIVKETTSAYLPELGEVVSKKEILELQMLMRRVPVSDALIKQAVGLVARTRPNKTNKLTYINQYVSWGAGPRASQYLILGAKARAVLRGELTPGEEDLRAVAHPVLRHRLVTSFAAEAEGVSADDLVDRLLTEK
ncbi:AAA family ATPase [candidate division WOR-3 bacterium]|nr:AAA family ATPase [candidate division WOR-3 bacterium]